MTNINFARKSIQDLLNFWSTFNPIKGCWITIEKNVKDKQTINKPKNQNKKFYKSDKKSFKEEKTI
jgi:hypothetical protein